MDDVPPLHASPPPTPTSSDGDHLNGLAIAHYIVGGLGMLFGFFPLIYVGLGMFFVFGGANLNHGNGALPPAVFGIVFAVIGGFFFLFCETVAICLIISGRNLHKRRRRTFSFVIACIACLWVPFGTILGVFTLIVLSRPSVQQLYASKLVPRS